MTRLDTFAAEVVEVLRVLRHDAHDWSGYPGPTDIAVALPDGRRLLLARNFNRTDGGWEGAVESTDGGQYCVEDGPGNDADVLDVATWINVRLRQGLKEF